VVCDKEANTEDRFFQRDTVGDDDDDNDNDDDVILMFGC
jgi:hypothetical protein